MSIKTVQDMDFGSVARILNLPSATASGHPVTFDQWNSAIQGLSWKDNCRVASVANVNISSPGASIDGIALAAGDRVLLRAQTVVTENGIYVWNGAAVGMARSQDAATFDELESAIVPVDEGTANAGTVWRQTQVNGVLGTNNVVFTAFGTQAPAASTSSPGLVQIATQAVVDAGTDAAQAVTANTLANYAGRVRKVAANVGDGSSTQIDVTHNFNTTDLQVVVYRNGTPWDTVLCDVERPNANTVRLRFAAAPTANQYRIVIWA